MEDRNGIEDLADIHRVLSGDKSAFRPLVERYADRLVAFARSRGLDPEEAADLAQEVFLRAFRSLKTFRIGESFPAWLFAIAANRLRTKGRKRGRERDMIASVTAEEGAREEPDSLKEAERGFEAEAVRSAVAELPEDQRKVVELYYFAELPVADVASLLDIGEEAVKSRLFRARKRLRGILEPDSSEQPRSGSGGKD